MLLQSGWGGVRYKRMGSEETLHQWAELLPSSGYWIDHSRARLASGTAASGLKRGHQDPVFSPLLGSVSSRWALASPISDKMAASAPASRVLSFKSSEEEWASLS